MAQGLINLEIQTLNKNVGVASLETVVCAINFSNDSNHTIDQFVRCNNFVDSQKAEKELQVKYPDDTIRILMTKTRRIQ
jgi:hypothetical protein